VTGLEVELKLYVNIDSRREDRIEQIDNIEVDYSSDYDIFQQINKMKTKNVKKKEPGDVLLGNKRKRETDLDKYIKTYRNVKYINLKAMDFRVEIDHDIIKPVEKVIGSKINFLDDEKLVSVLIYYRI
jgi:hypothetical protein